jgi:hypothetical protein
MLPTATGTDSSDEPSMPVGDTTSRVVPVMGCALRFGRSGALVLSISVGAGLAVTRVTAVGSAERGETPMEGLIDGRREARGSELRGPPESAKAVPAPVNVAKPMMSA